MYDSLDETYSGLPWLVVFGGRDELYCTIDQHFVRVSATDKWLVGGCNRTAVLSVTLLTVVDVGNENQSIIV